MSEARFFKLQGDDFGIEGGRYKDTAKRIPTRAARSAARRIFKLIEENKAKYNHLNHSKKIKIILRETTRGSGKETFYFNVWREEFAKPIEKNINGTTVVKHYKVMSEVCKSH